MKNSTKWLLWLARRVIGVAIPFILAFQLSLSVGINLIITVAAALAEHRFLAKPFVDRSRLNRSKVSPAHVVYRNSRLANAAYFFPAILLTLALHFWIKGTAYDFVEWIVYMLWHLTVTIVCGITLMYQELEGSLHSDPDTTSGVQVQDEDGNQSPEL